MVQHLHDQFLIADGSRARWVSRPEDGHGFVTTLEQLNEHRKRSQPPRGQVFEGVHRRAFTVEQLDEAVKRRAAFAADLAKAIEQQIERHDTHRFVVVAPARMLNEILGQLSQTARGRVAATLARDLTETPDHDLSSWLATLELTSGAERRPAH